VQASISAVATSHVVTENSLVMLKQLPHPPITRCPRVNNEYGFVAAKPDLAAPLAHFGVNA
jgi:hypothetical protein